MDKGRALTDWGRKVNPPGWLWGRNAKRSSTGAPSRPEGTGQESHLSLLVPVTKPAVGILLRGEKMTASEGCPGRRRAGRMARPALLLPRINPGRFLLKARHDDGEDGGDGLGEFTATDSGELVVVELAEGLAGQLERLTLDLPFHSVPHLPKSFRLINLRRSSRPCR